MFSCLLADLTASAIEIALTASICVDENHLIRHRVTIHSIELGRIDLDNGVGDIVLVIKPLYYLNMTTLDAYPQKDSVDEPMNV